MLPLKYPIFFFTLFYLTLRVVAATDTNFVKENIQTKVLRVLKDDCANCHGLYRLGGLGPPLTPQRLQQLPIETVEMLISEGIPGKFMPPWKAILTKKEIHFLAHYLRTTPVVAPQIEIRKFNSTKSE